MPAYTLLIGLVLLAASSSDASAQDPLSELLSPDGGAAAAEGEDGVATESIETDSSPADDEEIRRRLLGIYGELDALLAVEPRVANGIVTLTGTAGSTRGAERAVEIASQVEGVVDVVDEMAVDANVGRRLRATFERLRGAALATVAALPVLLLALATVALFWWLGRALSARRSLFASIAPNGFIAELLGGVARIVTVLLGVFLALSLLDATSIIGTVLGAVGIVGLAVGFAVRDTVENWIASVLLSLRTPFLARDYVAIGEHEGAVARLTSRATILISLDGNHIRIPNATVYKAIIVNYSRNPERRFEFAVGVDTDLDLNEVQRSALTAVHEVPGVLDSPPASVLVEELGDSNVTLIVLAWIDQRRSDVRKVRSESIRFVKQAFDAAGIVMPEPIYRVNVNAGSPGAKRLTGAIDALADAAPGPVDAIVSTGPARAGGDAAAGEGRRDACDTSLDTAVEATLEREIAEGGRENLLGGDAVRE